MKRYLVICCLFLLASTSVNAAHIKGGEVFYEYLGAGSNGSERYRITLRLFIDCNSTGSQIDPDVNIGIYKNATNQSVQGSPFTLPNTLDEQINLSAPSPCIVNPSPVCYRVRLYSSIIELPREALGYTVIFQRCCRINGIENIDPNNSIGASYTCQIHGTSSIGVNETNNNPQFLVKDTVLVCQNRKFSIDFGAVDTDAGDSLSYQLCAAYRGGSTNSPVVPNPPSPSQLSEVTYANGFSGSQPLGPDVIIDPITGLLSGIAPSGGDYVVCVCLTEWRRGKIVSTHRKDFIVRVDARCDFAAADLKPAYITCDGFDFNFRNEAPFSSLIHTYSWDFGLLTQKTDTSSLAEPRFVYPDTGIYKVKLVINPGEECSDSATTLVSVFPGFFPDFSTSGSCQLNPFQFTDNTTTQWGQVFKWNWDFGDETTTTDISTQKNPLWKYSTTGNKRVSLTVENTKGCVKTLVKDNVLVRDKPLVTLPFRDTLICSIDTLQLSAGGGITYAWSPAPATVMLNSTSSTPLVYPKSTTTFKVTVSDNGCINTDSIRVRVVDFVTLNGGPDATICLTDGYVMNPISDGLSFAWSPAGTLNNPKLKRPVATPLVTTVYQVTASIGKCNTTDFVTLTTIPYPVSNAGPDFTICYEDTIQLRGSITGSSFNWSPASSLLNASTLNPLAYPLNTTPYILSVRDTLGCPKPKLDTVLVTVRPKILAFAGRDTAVIVGQPLQLQASGADFFQWTPRIDLNASNIQSPVTVLNDNISYVVRVFTEDGCFNYDTINVKVFKTNPDIFVPNAFTPGRESNNRFRPITAGISTIEFFRVYNRWGQLLFSSNDATRGWDGTFGGKPQDAGAYVWMVRGKDFTGKIVSKKGTMVLIR
jgi:gliding motility-associated-like protein